MARADIHVFGSTSGYRTVAASPGVRADEVRELEHFQFGEISTGEAIARLESQPTMTVRTLASGRVAISRMIPAGVDDAGRPTIDVITLVTDARVLDTDLGAIERLASDATRWREAREKVRSGIDLPSGATPSADPRDPALLRVLDAWMFAVRSGSVAVLPESAVADLFRCIATLDPSDRRRCRFGIGINSLSAPVDICTMMPGASVHGARSVVRPAPVGSWHMRETEFAQFRASSGSSTWVPTTQMIGTATITTAASDLGDSSEGFAAARGLDERQKRLIAMSIIAAVCSTLLLAFAAAMYLGSSSPRSNGVVLAGGDDGATNPSAPLPPIGGSRRSGFGEMIETPVASAPAETVGPTEPPAAPPDTKPSVAPESALSADANVDVSETVPAKVWIYPDKDSDTFGVEEGKTEILKSELVNGLPPAGFALRFGDECPDEGSRNAIKDCGCIPTHYEEDETGKPIDFDKDGKADCTQDDDCDGTPNCQEPEWTPNEIRGQVLASLAINQERLKEAVSLSDNDAFRGVGRNLSFDQLVMEIVGNANGVASIAGEVGVNVVKLSEAQADLFKDGMPSHCFVQKLWSGHKRNQVPDRATIEVWLALLHDMKAVVDRLDEAKQKLLNAAKSFPERGTNSKTDRTQGDARDFIHEKWKVVEEHFKGCVNIADAKKLDQEIAALNKLKEERVK